jgi:hypothetical protein
MTKEDKARLQELFGKMTIGQIMTYNKHFTPTIIPQHIKGMEVKSSDKAKIYVWHNTVQDIYDNLERYQKVDAII